jgi:hypothetical protein
VSNFILGFIVGGTFGMILMSVLAISNKGEYSNEELANKTNEIR